MPKPNLLLITADQLRWDTLGCAGNPVIRTPNLDGIAARGVRFSNAFTPDPVCVPARASIMTGNYPQVCTGVKACAGRIRDGQPLLTEVLKSAGYRAYACGKLHFDPYSPPGQPRLTHGFETWDSHESGRILEQFDPHGKLSGVEDYFDYLKSVGWGGYTRAHGIGNNDVRPCASPLPEEHHVDHWIADRTIARIDAHRKESAERPFFLWMSSPKPHAPYDPPRPWDAMYDPRRIPRPFGSASMLETRDPGIEHTRRTHAADSLSPEAWQVIRSYYYGLTSFLDAQIGRVLDHLKQMGQLENTVILFTADHGDLIGDFGACFKGNHLNGSVRVPFLAAGPGIARGQVSEALVGLQDILPTFAQIGGGRIGQQVQGRSLCETLAQPASAAAVRDVYYSTVNNACGQTAMICDGRWKYVYSEANGTQELYDQKEDPAELKNLAGDAESAPLLGRMRERFIATARELGDTDLLADGTLKTKAVDRAAFAKLPVKGMGWRWY